MLTEQEKYNELALYTLQHPDPSFIHQYIVDAYAAQNADENTKPITLAFALAGLYLYLEKNYSGKEVQNAHIKMAKEKKIWPKFNLPEDRGDIIVTKVLEVSPGPERDEMINKWSQSVWDSWKDSKDKVRILAQAELNML